MRKGEQTRQEIIPKAAPIFNQKGYDGAALSDLMRAAGLEKGGIYRHFESKQELAEQAFDHAWKLALDTRFEGTEGIPNSVDRLKQIIRNFRDRRAGLAGRLPATETPPSILTMAILGCELSLAGRLARGWIASNRLPKRVSDETRSGAMLIRRHWQR